MSIFSSMIDADFVNSLTEKAEGKSAEVSEVVVGGLVGELELGYSMVQEETLQRTDKNGQAISVGGVVLNLVNPAGLGIYLTVRPPWLVCSDPDGTCR
jgi:hypothetical protein